MRPNELPPKFRAVAEYLGVFLIALGIGWLIATLAAVALEGAARVAELAGWN